MRTSFQSAQKPFLIAWALGCIFYFLEYVVRSAPAVMIPELSAAFQVNALGVSTVLGLYYYTYSVTSLIAGLAFDRMGARYPVVAGIGILSLGCFLFAVPDLAAGDSGRLLQGFGSAFGFTGCVYLASRGLPPRYIATAIGFTQCFGMLGGSAGQFVVGPLIHNGLSIHFFWIITGAACALICLLLLFITPKEQILTGTDSKKATYFLLPYKTIFTNIQSYLCGLISGFLFAPTTIFAMTWGVAFFQKDRMTDYSSAVLICSMVPLGWVIGCPVFGWVSDRIEKRKPALIAGILLMMISFSQLLFLPGLIPALATMFIFGIASGAAMIPYSIIQEANPAEIKGSATGAINFLTFGVTALLGPLFSYLFGKNLLLTAEHEAHFQSAGLFWLLILFLALLLSMIVKETGRKAVISN